MALSFYDTNEIFIPSWVYDQAFVFVIGFGGSGQLFDSTDFSGTAEFGYSSIAPDGANGVWFGPFSGPLIHYDATATITPFAYAISGIISLGNALDIVSGGAFAGDASGNIYTATDSGMVLVNTWPSKPERELVPALGKIWGMLPTISGVGSILPIPPYTSGVVTVPMTHVACIAGSGNTLAVGGWNPASIPSGFSALAFDPTTPSLMAGASVAASAVTLYTADGSGLFTPNGQQVSGLAGINSVAWSPVGTALFATSASNNSLYVLSYIFGTLALAQTIPLSGAAAVAITLDSVHGLVTQPSLNTVTPIMLVGSGWVSGTPFALTAASAIVPLTAVEMFIGNSSGFTDTLLTSGGSWVLGATTALPFNPSQMILTAPGTVAAVGTSGSSGYVYTQGVTGTFAGSADGIFAFRNQYVVADNTNHLLHVFQYFNGAFTPKSTITAPSGIGNLSFGGIDILAPASGLTALYRLAAPFTLRAHVAGQVSLYNGSAWTSIFLNAEQQPECLAFDVSGNLSVVTLQNQLITIWTSSGVIAPSGVQNIPTFAGQLSGVPIGFSEIAWVFGILYGTSSLNESFIQIGGTSTFVPSGSGASPGPTPPGPGPMVGVRMIHALS